MLTAAGSRPTGALDLLDKSQEQAAGGREGFTKGEGGGLM